MRTSIKNFTKADVLEVIASVHQSCGPLCALIMRAGSLSFQFDMRPEQAREMAAALIAGAEEMESLALLEVVAA